VRPALTLALLLAAAPAALAADAPAAKADLTFENRGIVTLRATITGADPAERAAAIVKRLEALEENELGGEITIHALKIGTQEGKAVYLGRKLLFALVQGDLDPVSDETVDQLAANAKARLAEAFKARKERLSPQAVLRGAIYSAAATAALVLVVWLLLLARRGLQARLAARAQESLTWLVVRGVDMRAQVALYLRRTFTLGFWIITLVLLYLWAAFVLEQFPYTQPWGTALAGRMWAVVADLALAVAASIPGLFTVAVIFAVTVFIERLVRTFFFAVERGTIEFAGLHRETVSATRRIALTLIWLFAIAFAYPFLPGSGSQAFQGISILAGLMLTLGSAGLVTQAMNGLVLVYSRALARDDFVKIGELEGTVLEVGTLSTKICSVEGEEVTVPNSVVVSSQIKNYSRRASTQGPTVSTSVSIGYDVPWRQVQALLVEAALATQGVKSDPAPYVLQRSLSDFYVVYDLIASIGDSHRRPSVQSALLANILDKFNERGVQILSPHYMQQPGEPAVVPKEKWFAAPAKKKEGA